MTRQRFQLFYRNLLLNHVTKFRFNQHLIYTTTCLLTTQNKKDYSLRTEIKPMSAVFSPNFHCKRSKATLNRPHLDFQVHFYIKFMTWTDQKSVWTRQFGLLPVLRENTVSECQILIVCCNDTLFVISVNW